MCFGYGKVREGRKDLPSLLLVQATRAIGDLLAGAWVDVVSCLLGNETECCSHIFISKHPQEAPRTGNSVALHDPDIEREESEMIKRG